MSQTIITSHHTVKPSSPTPFASKIHKLSFLDQIAPSAYITLIFFYQNEQSCTQHEEISRRLKQSLSETLTIFYPLAGRMNQNLFVDCNDAGVEYFEARVDGRLSQFLQNPKMEELKQFLPADTSSYEENAMQLLVKTSFFDCGGFSVGVCFSHKIGDAASAMAFMNAWGDACRKGETCRTFHPSFDLALHFPPRDLPASASGLSAGITKEKIVTKRLVFDREKVENLRKKIADSSDEIKDPSRVEAVSGFIWRSFIEAEAHKVEVGTKETTSFLACHMVSVRRRAVPPMPDHSFGNCFTLAVSPDDDDDDNGSIIDVAVSKLRAAIRGVDDEYIKALRDDDEFVRGIPGQLAGLFRPETLFFTSWLRFPVYEVNFGWGKPLWVCTATLPYVNLVVMMDTPSGDGVEAWINVPNNDCFQILQTNFNKLLN